MTAIRLVIAFADQQVVDAVLGARGGESLEDGIADVEHVGRGVFDGADRKGPRELQVFAGDSGALQRGEDDRLVVLSALVNAEPLAGGFVA